MKIEFRDLQGNFIFFDVRVPSVKVGRSRKCDITISDESISREHLTIETRQGDDAIVKDLGSSNGTHINDKKLEPNMPEAFTPLFSFSLGKGILMRMMEESESFPEDARVEVIKKKSLMRPDPALQTQRSVATKMNNRARYASVTSEKADRKKDKKDGFNIVRFLLVVLVAVLLYFVVTES